MTLIEKVRAFKKAYVDLVEEWSKFENDLDELNHEEYPFDKSFDELEVVKWCDSLEKQLTIMPHGKALHDFAIEEIDLMVANAEGTMDIAPVIWDEAKRTIEMYRMQFSITEYEANEWYDRLNKIHNDYYKGGK